MIYGELTSPRIGELAPRSTALLPLASIEQHGNHLPVCTDTALVTEVARRAEAVLPDRVLLLPTLWAGSSHHHFGFPGTVSIHGETYIRVLMDLVESLCRTGFRRIVLLNGHGGNVVPATEALTRLDLAALGDPWVIAATYWTLADSFAGVDIMESPKLSHACEYETSMMLALRTDWVDMAAARGHRTERGSAFYDPMGYKRSRVTVAEPFHQKTPTGAMGSPEKATAGKGEVLLAAAAEQVVELLKDLDHWKRGTSTEDSSSS